MTEQAATAGSSTVTGDVEVVPAADTDPETEARARILAAGRDYSLGMTDPTTVFVVYAGTDRGKADEFVLAVCATAVVAELAAERHGTHRTRIETYGLLHF